MDPKTSSVIPAKSADLAEFVGNVMSAFDENAAVSLERIEEGERELERYRQHEDYDEAREFLNASRNFFQALALVQANADFATAVPLLEQAKNAYLGLGLADLANGAEGLRLYFAGILELQRQNVGAALDLLKTAPEHLRHAGGFGSLFAPLIDHMAPDHLFAAGAAALAKHDFTLARVLLEEAAQKAESLAKTYHEEGSPGHHFCQGLGRLYRSYFATFQLWGDFARFDLDRLEQAAGPAQSAREARDLFSKAGLENKIWQNCYRLAGVLSGILDVLPPAAVLLRALLEAKPAPEIDHAALRKRVQEAENEAVAVGETGLGLVRVCSNLAATLDNLRRYDLARPRPKTAPSRSVAAGPKSPTRLFVMMPFSEENKIVEEALQNVFEAEPYWFDLILARDRTLRRNLFENVKAHMELVDGFCADISDLNPNVMLELGMTENDSRERPVLVLRREGSKDPPSDLKGRLYVEYSLPGPEVADRVQRLTRELRQKLSEIEDVEQLLQRRQARYLSTDHIRKVAERVRLVLKDDEIRQLQKAFTTIEELESAEAALVARRAGFDTDLASAIAKAFRPKTKKPVR